MRRLLNADVPVMLDRRLELHPQVSLRPEPFGALAYHHGNRRLVFLRHPDVLAVVRVLPDHESVRDALAACEVDERRWPAFERALTSLVESEMLHDRDREPAVAR